jgi:shikimate kinase
MPDVPATSVLLTGVSGTGKSALVAALAAGGRRAVDLDQPAFSEWVPATGDTVEPGRDWVWREDRVAALLDAEAGELFASGCASNMGRLVSRFDRVVLLSAPRDVLAARLAARPAGAYGSRPQDAARALALVETVEPLLRRIAHHELDTDRPVDESVAALLAAIG